MLPHLTQRFLITLSAHLARIANNHHTEKKTPITICRVCPQLLHVIIGTDCQSGYFSNLFLQISNVTIYSGFLNTDMLYGFFSPLCYLELAFNSLLSN